jgi:hypothetical protein
MAQTGYGSTGPSGRPSGFLQIVLFLLGAAVGYIIRDVRADAETMNLVLNGRSVLRVAADTSAANLGDGSAGEQDSSAADSGVALPTPPETTRARGPSRPQ